MTDLVGSRKRKGGSPADKIKKRKKREPAMVEVMESSSVPVNGPSLGEDETAVAVQALFDELLNHTRSEDTGADEKKKVTFVGVLDTAEEVETYLDGEKRKALQARMMYKKPEEFDVVSPVPGVMPKWEPSPKVQPPPNETDYMVCLCHNVRLEKRVSKGGWPYVKCPRQPCLLFCPEEGADEYMRQVYKHVHPTLCDKWETLVCYCRQPVTIRQSRSEKNPGRLYVGCCAGRKCKFFHWTDLPLTEKYLQWFDEEKDLPPVHGHTWGNRGVDDDVLPPLQYSEVVWRRTPTSAHWGGRSDA